MRFLLAAVVLLGLMNLAPAPPVNKAKPTEKPDSSSQEHEEDSEMDTYGLDYGRYLQQIVQVLEEDKEFAKKLENVSEDHIRTGEVAKHLEFVKHSVRSKLDELKRMEVERLRTAIRKKMEMNELAEHQIQIPNHLDVHNQDTFEIKDLEKLIQSATKDLEQLDKQRRKEFKDYEMEKEYRYRHSLSNMTEEDKNATIRHHDELKQKHKEHPQIHHPGSKAQLEQVWEEKDHLPKEEFNPNTFFSLHDVNSDGYLDIQEVEALLSLEVKKMYDNNNEEDDPVEMQEEYNRMREHIYKEIDTNKDGLISRQEFLDMTKQAGFEQDEGWKGLDEQDIYSENDMQDYERRRQAEIKKLYDTYGNQYPNHVYPGDVPYYAYDPQPPYQMPQGYQQGVPPQGYQQGVPPQQQQYHPQQGVPPQQQHYQQPQYQQGMPPQHQPPQYQQGVPPQHQQQQGIPPQHQQQGIPPQHQQQVPSHHQQQQGIPPQQQQQQGIPPQHQQQQQVPPQHQQQQGIPPQQQQQGIPPQHQQQQQGIPPQRQPPPPPQYQELPSHPQQQQQQPQASSSQQHSGSQEGAPRGNPPPPVSGSSQSQEIPQKSAGQPSTH